MKFTSIEKAAEKPFAVKVLDLEGQWVETAQLAGFPNLILLSLSNCDINLSAGVKLSQLEDLLIVHHAGRTHKQLAFLPQVFPDLLSLQLENVINSRDIGEHIDGFGKLEKLIINQGRMEDISFLSKAPKTLTHLDVGANSLREIPDGIGRLVNLEKLHAATNLLKKVSAKIKNLPKLRSLHLGSNLISRLPRLSAADNIFTVDISNNHFQTIPRSLTQSKQLHELYLSNNSLMNLPPAICDMPRLRLLQAYSCQMKALPRNFNRLQSLRILEMGQNLFQNIPPSICKISKLEVLNLNNNQIKKVSKGIENLTELRRLELAGNSLHDLPAALLNLKKLYEVNLERNRFLEIPRVLLAFSETEFKGVPGKKFLQAYRKAFAGQNFLERKIHLAAYDFMTGQESRGVSKEILANLTCITLPVLQRKAREKLVNKLRNKSTVPKLTASSKWTLIGQQSVDFQSLIPAEMIFSEDKMQADIWIVGNHISQSELENLSGNSTKLLTETEFLQQLFRLYPPYLLLPEYEDSARNLEELFSSEEAVNKDIALSAMPVGGLPQSLKIPVICLAVNRYDRNEHTEESICQLCQLYLTPKELDVAEYFWGFWMEKYRIPVSPSMRTLQDLCMQAGFEFEKFYAFYVNWKQKSDLPF